MEPIVQEVELAWRSVESLLNGRAEKSGSNPRKARAQPSVSRFLRLRTNQAHFRHRSFPSFERQMRQAKRPGPPGKNCASNRASGTRSSLVTLHRFRTKPVLVGQSVFIGQTGETSFRNGKTGAYGTTRTPTRLRASWHTDNCQTFGHLTVSEIANPPPHDSPARSGRQP